MDKPCKISWCVALVKEGSEFCTVHDYDPTYVPSRERDDDAVVSDEDDEDVDDSDPEQFGGEEYVAPNGDVDG
jgi:hypothetical protein